MRRIDTPFPLSSVPIDPRPRIRPARPNVALSFLPCATCRLQPARATQSATTKEQRKQLRAANKAQRGEEGTHEGQNMQHRNQNHLIVSKNESPVTATTNGTFTSLLSSAPLSPIHSPTLLPLLLLPSPLVPLVPFIAYSDNTSEWSHGHNDPTNSHEPTIRSAMRTIGRRIQHSHGRPRDRQE